MMSSQLDQNIGVPKVFITLTQKALPWIEGKLNIKYTINEKKLFQINEAWQDPSILFLNSFFLMYTEKTVR